MHSSVCLSSPLLIQASSPSPARLHLPPSHVSVVHGFSSTADSLHSALPLRSTHGSSKWVSPLRHGVQDPPHAGLAHLPALSPEPAFPAAPQFTLAPAHVFTRTGPRAQDQQRRAPGLVLPPDHAPLPLWAPLSQRGVGTGQGISGPFKTEGLLSKLDAFSGSQELFSSFSLSPTYTTHKVTDSKTLACTLTHKLTPSSAQPVFSHTHHILTHTFKCSLMHWRSHPCSHTLSHACRVWCVLLIAKPPAPGAEHRADLHSPSLELTDNEHTHSPQHGAGFTRHTHTHEQSVCTLRDRADLHYTRPAHSCLPPSPPADPQAPSGTRLREAFSYTSP